MRRCTFPSVPPPLSVLCVLNAELGDGELRLRLGEHGGAGNLGDAVLAPALAQRDASGGRVRHDISADWLESVGSREHGVSIRVGHHLVGHHDGDAKLVSQPGQVAEELAQVHLPRAELAATLVLGAEQIGDGVDYDEAEASLRHHPRGGDEELGLVLRVVSLGVRHVVQHRVGVHAEALGDGDEPLRSERALRVDVHGLTLGASLVERELASHRERVAQLRLARPELSVNLRKRSRLETPTQKLIQLRRARRHHDCVLPDSLNHRRRGEAQGNHLGGGHLELFNLHLAEPLDVLEVLLRRVRETLDGVNASLEELLDVGRRDTVFLQSLERERASSCHPFLPLLHVPLHGGLHCEVSHSFCCFDASPPAEK
mmetsp:Transcript_9448/g.41381  ORF Transcript_9448/g.41381 Transcript_9448/m.41381 type:complete len:372 (+) Transcript_9448:1081-2196(+)